MPPEARHLRRCRASELVAWLIESLETAWASSSSFPNAESFLDSTIDGWAALYLLRSELGPHAERLAGWLNSESVLFEPVVRSEFERRVPAAGFVKEEVDRIVSPTILLLDVIAEMDASIRSDSILDSAIRRIAEMSIPDSSRATFDNWFQERGRSVYSEQRLFADLNLVDGDEASSAVHLHISQELEPAAAFYRSRFLARRILGLPDDPPLPPEPVQSTP